MANYKAWAVNSPNKKYKIKSEKGFLMCLACCYTEGKLVDNYRYEAGLMEDNGIQYLVLNSLPLGYDADVSLSGIFPLEYIKHRRWNPSESYIYEIQAGEITVETGKREDKITLPDGKVITFVHENFIMDEKFYNEMKEYYGEALEKFFEIEEL